MRIEKFYIKNYRSILDSGEVNLDSKIAILIGKNESGKTCILKALESFKGDYEYAEDDLCLHSEAKEKIDSGATKGDVEIMTIWFEIEAEDIGKLKEIHPQLTKIKTLRITKYFNNSYRVESPEISLEDLKINTRKEIEKNLSEIKRLATSFKKRLDSHSQRLAPFNASKAQYDSIINEIIAFDPEANPDVDNVFNNFYDRFRSLLNRDGPIQNDIEAFIRKIEPHKNRIKDTLLKEEGVIDRILKILPSFMYFTEVEKLEDTIPIYEFLANKEKHKTLSNSIELSGLDVERIKDAGDYDILSSLRSASMTITGLVNQSWTQEKVNVNIGIVRDKIVISIFDNVIKKEHPPSIRSQGFQWFLSFYINFTAGSRGELKNTIILLDDPGVYLHPSGQKDLLDALEKISESNQIVFSTHSPFMIDREKLKRIRIVSKKEGKGTLIEEKYYKSDYDALQPIRASIGMTIGDTLFITKRNLLVEGYSDELILEAMSEVVSKKKKNYINTSKISILPVNGADKMPYFATLLAKENLKFLVLLDYDREGRKTTKELKEKFGMNDNNILTLEILTEKGNDLEMEDLIDIDFYLEALNLAYGDIFQKKLRKQSITTDDLKEASFKGIKEFFREKKIGVSKRVDKIKVAKRIYDLVAEDKVLKPQTISNFSQLFKMINERL